MRLNLFFLLVLPGLMLGLLYTPGYTQDLPVDPVRARIIQGWDLPDGRHVAGLELRLAPGWKTYWRNPGDAGIPPRFDWTRSRNIREIEVRWPAPKVYKEYGLHSIGYDERVLVPLYVTPRQDGDMRVRGRMDLGVCADVCLPYALSLDATLTQDQSAAVPSIAAALASLPFTAQEAGVRQVTCVLEPSPEGLRFEARIEMPTTGTDELVIIEPNLPDIWVFDAKTHRKGDVLRATSEFVHQNGAAFAIDRRQIRLTVLGGDYAVEIQGCAAHLN